MTLEELGFNNQLKEYGKAQNLDSFLVGRVILEHKERYIVKTENDEFDSELLGNLRYTAESRDDFPVVGDWVALSEYDENKAIIHAVYPRHSKLERQAVGKSGQKQIIATNIDCAMIVQAVDRDFNINRIERYLTICHTSEVVPLIVLNKVDVISERELKKLEQLLSQRIKDIPIITTSNITNLGIEELKKSIKIGKTYCLLGSSGVGKSTLLNTLSGKELMKTGEISLSVNKGKHVTSHRELVVLENGGIIIDNPGMREVGIADSNSGLEATFETILLLSENCRFNDCTHSNEIGCAILKALDNGDIEAKSYENYQKMECERLHYEATTEEKRKKDKDLGKLIKHYVNIKKQNKL